MKSVEQLDGRVAVITGGASGIGLGVVERLLDEGIKVVVAGRDEAALDRAVSRHFERVDLIG